MSCEGSQHGKGRTKPGSNSCWMISRWFHERDCFNTVETEFPWDLVGHCQRRMAGEGFNLCQPWMTHGYHGWTMDGSWMGHGWTMDVSCIVCTIHFQGAIMFDQKDCWIHLDPVFRQAKPNSSRHRRLVFWTVPSMFPLCLANPERVRTSPPWFKFTSWVHNEMWVSELATVQDYFFPCPLVSSSKDAQLTARIHQALEPGTRGKAGKHLKTPPFQIRQIHDDPCSPELGDLWKV